MIALHRFLENPFDDRQISLAELLSFTSDHLARMIANNQSGELTPRITATTNALALVQDSATDDQTKKAIRKARKKVKDSFRRAVLGEVAKVHGAVVAKYGQKSPEVAECFPLGRSIFGECRDDRLASHVETMKNGLQAHVSDLGDALIEAVTALTTQWGGILADSETSGGNATTSQEGKRLARENLQLTLFLNLLKLGEMLARQPEKLGLYMQQSLLQDPAKPRDEAPEPPPTPPPATPPIG